MDTITAYHDQHDRTISEREGIPQSFVQMNRNFQGMLSREAYDRACSVLALLKADPNRVEGRPAFGDIVEAHFPSITYLNAHLEHDPWNENEFSCCGHPMEPHVTQYGRVVASGGPWFGVKAAELRDTGRTALKRFWTWGGSPGAGKGVTFMAEVKVWEYRKSNA